MNCAMKNYLSLAFLILCFQLRGGEVISNLSLSEKEMVGTTASGKSSTIDSDKGDIPAVQFKQLAKKHKIATRKISGLRGVKSGYYLVAGVFGEQRNALKFNRELVAKKLRPHILFNPANELNYVYLQESENGLEAIRLCLSGLNGKYKKELWILQVEQYQEPLIQSSVPEVDRSKKHLSISDFKNKARQLKIANRVIRDLPDTKPGFYLISGAYGEVKNANRQLSGLRNRSFSPGLVKNPVNKLNYVYLKRFDYGEDAIKAHRDKLNGAFTGKMWILVVPDHEDISVTSVHSLEKEESAVKPTEEDEIHRIVEAKDIPLRSDPGFIGTKSGYYMVSGVFGDPNNAQAHLLKLKSRYHRAGIIKHPKSELNYVYLAEYQSGLSAIEDYLSGMKDSYKDKLWILHTDSPESGAKNQETRTDVTTKEINPDYTLSVLQSYLLNKRTNAKDPVYNDKLLEKADSYFDKMWYSEAAELYEMILNEAPENHTFEIIRKAGDAHYFNTNMERAFHWYDLLYSKYKSDMRADNLFKYAHSLKGTGKYGRAKRLMKLYNKALKTEGAAKPYRPRRQEAVLDNIMELEEEMEIKNIAVNSEYSDFSPMFYGNDRLVYSSAMDSSFLTTRRYKWNNQPYLDLYVAKINEQSNEVRSAVKFSKQINTKYHEAAVTFSPDLETIYFTRNNYGKKLKRDNKGINHLKIYMAKKMGNSWSEAIELPFNSDEYSTGHPALSPDGTKLYFVSDMPGSIGKTDIFVVDVLEDGQFSEPRNLGPEINTERREMFPFISDRKLYFSSDGHTGLGGLDVYQVEISDEGFSEVMNMGKPINSRRDDFSYIVNENTQKGFFASNRRGGKGDDDIYSFKRPLPEEPNENAIAGVVTEVVSGEVMPKALVELLDENNMKLMEVETEEDGSFVFEELDSNTRYIIRTKKENYFEDEQLVTTEDNERVEMEVNLKRLEELIVLEDGIQKLKINMIFFDFDKFNIRNDAASELDKLVEVMTKYPTMVIKIESHTDSRGKRAYNKYLSDKRAKSTRDYLISKGIEPERIQSAIGYGEERLLNECNGTVRCSSAKHQLNRRSEFIIVNM